MESLRCANGLVVPRGYGGGSARFKQALRTGRETTPMEKRRYTRAGSVAEGMTLRGQKTRDAYEVLAVEPGTEFVTLTVMNTRTSDVRPWRRRPDFRVELV